MTTRKGLVFVSGILLLLFALSGGLFAKELDLSFEEAEYSYIFQVLGEAQGLNVVVDPNVTGKGTFQLKNVSFAEALDLIATVSGYQYRLENGTLLVATPQMFENLAGRELRYVQVHTLSASEVLDALKLVMPSSDVYVHPQGGLVVLQGSKQTLDQAEELLLALERSQSPIPIADDSSARSLLEIFKDLSAEMELNLVADPAFRNCQAASGYTIRIRKRLSGRSKAWCPQSRNSRPPWRGKPGKLQWGEDEGLQAELREPKPPRLPCLCWLTQAGSGSMKTEKV